MRLHNDIIISLAEKYCSEIFDVELLSVSHNIVYKINSKNPFILRITPENRQTKNGLFGEIKFINFLVNNRINAAAPMYSSANEAITEIIFNNEIFYAIAFFLADGMQWYERNDVEYFEHIGAELGKIHKASKKYQPKNIKRRQYFNNGHLTEANNIFRNNKQELLKPYENLLAFLSQMPKSSDNYGLVRGDFMLSNFNITRKNKVTVYDFDECEYSWFLYDIATYIFYHITGGNPVQAMNKQNEAEEALYKILSGYSKKNTLPLQELSSIDHFFKLRDFILLSTILERGISNSWEEEYIFTAFDRIINH